LTIELSKFKPFIHFFVSSAAQNSFSEIFRSVQNDFLNKKNRLQAVFQNTALRAFNRLDIWRKFFDFS